MLLYYSTCEEEPNKGGTHLCFCRCYLVFFWAPSWMSHSSSSLFLPSCSLSILITGFSFFTAFFSPSVCVFFSHLIQIILLSVITDLIPNYQTLWAIVTILIESFLKWFHLNATYSRCLSSPFNISRVFLRGHPRAPGCF